MELLKLKVISLNFSSTSIWFNTFSKAELIFLFCKSIFSMAEPIEGVVATIRFSHIGIGTGMYWNIPGCSSGIGEGILSTTNKMHS